MTRTIQRFMPMMKTSLKTAVVSDAPHRPRG
jgi:hypothetical protein